MSNLKYGFKENTSHQAIIFKLGTEAASDEMHGYDTAGMVVGSSEWGWISEENGRRICAALTYFDGVSTEELYDKIEEHKTTINPVILREAINRLENKDKMCFILGILNDMVFLNNKHGLHSDINELRIWFKRKLEWIEENEKGSKS